jgi:EAL domain-containing protein (putative c-di-GMP-specific phosphodiesterase class I)
VGSGHSGLESIAKLRPEFLKIDMALVKELDANPFNRAMVKAIVGIAHGIDAKVIAEGIERDEEAQILQAVGVDFGQGYHLGRPEGGTEQG